MSPIAGAGSAAGGPLPMLARGRHRSPRKGACFMEIVSYLAGEKWSDHPRCTHPLLGALARAVNDASSDAARPLLAPLIPAVVGLDGDDVRWSVEIAMIAACEALPVASGGRQNALAVGLLTCERVLDELEDRPPGLVRPWTAAVLDEVPDAAAWARDFMGPATKGVPRFATGAAPEIVRLSVEGIAEACVPDPDRRLRELLASAIEECRTWAGMSPVPEVALDPTLWQAVCRPLTR